MVEVLSPQGFNGIPVARLGLSNPIGIIFSIPLLIVAPGGMFSERGGVVNIALEDVMVMGAFCSIFFINQVQDYISGNLLLVLAIVLAFTSKNSQAPRASGVPYDKGSR